MFRFLAFTVAVCLWAALLLFLALLGSLFLYGGF